MEVLLEEDILDFCNSDEAERDDKLSSSVSTQRPSHVLPVSQLCAEIHSTARTGTLDYAHFRACWERFVVWHFRESGSDAFIIHVGDGDPQEHNLPLAVLELPRPRMPANQRRSDARDRDEERKETVLRRRLEDFQTRARRSMALRVREDPKSWRDLCNPPDILHDGGYSGQNRPDVVLDTNVFVQLLNALPPDGNMKRLSLEKRLAAAIEPIRQAFTTPYGAACKLLVPLSVLIEAEGVTATNPQYPDARNALRAIALGSMLGDAFSFECPALDTFAAFLYLHEKLDQSRVQLDLWPRFGDALVIAHGLAHGLPVASTEWTDANNIHWRRAGIHSLFPFLELA